MDGDALKQINAGLARLAAIRAEHSGTDVCAADGQTFPCITVQALNRGPDIMSSNSKGAQSRAKRAGK